MERKMRGSRKPLKAIWLMLLSLFGISVLTCCQSSSLPEKDDIISVILVDNEHFTVLENTAGQVDGKENKPNIAYINRNSDVTFVISTEEDYVPEKCSYEQHEFSEIDENVFSVRLINVKYSSRVSVALKDMLPVIEGANTITYDPNGGTMIKGKRRTYSYTTDHHPRPNTSIGTDIMYREGYNLIGWNTEDDGSGEHIGLGSRYLDLENPDFTLYAEWAEYSEASNFIYINDDEGNSRIIKYLGNEDIISVPEYLGDKPVSSIQQYAFTNATAKTIILPKSIQSLDSGAFVGCAIDEIYLYDNIVTVHDDCFVNCPNLATVHINAIEGARYVTADRNVTYADKVDRLIINKDKKKLIIFGGSGAYYDVDACLLKQFHPNYEVFNLAVNGYFNGPFQMEAIMPFMKEGDCLLHVVEMCGKFQFMTDISMCNYESATGYDYRFYCALEQNFDIIPLVDIRHVNGFFDGFTIFNNAREKKPTIPYTNYTDFADERGDYMPNDKRVKATPKEGSKTISGEGTISPKALSEEGLSRLNNYYQQLSEKGVITCFAYCAVNKDSLSTEDLRASNIDIFENNVSNGLSQRCRIINSIQSVLYDFEWFADSDWHLDYEHALVFTEQINSRLGNI